MTRDGRCDRTEEILRAAGADSLPPELAAHARFCPACADALLVDGFLAREAEAARGEAEGRLPEAGALWRRARADAEAEALSRALRPIAAVRRLAWVSGGAVAALLLWRLGPEAAGWVGRLGRLAEGLRWSPPAGADLSGEAILVAAVGLGLFGLLAGLYSSWAEEA